MSYQVLARKYRPQNFAEVLGQEAVTRTLQNALDQKRIHHAYLFTGARGIGKTTVARILAKSLNCEKGPSKEPCNQCPLCQEITIGNSIDVQEIDGASNTSVDDVREIREQAKYLPAKGRYKIYIIDEVHMLSTSAFNALLKTLEEPPPHVVFVFATTESHKIPATILSRCQRYDFRRLPAPQIVACLKAIAAQEQVVVDEPALHLIAKESQGSLRDAQSLLDQAIAYAGSNIGYADLNQMFGFLDRARLMEFVQALVRQEVAPALDALEEFFQKGTDLTRLALEIVEQLRNLYIIKQMGTIPAWLELGPEEGKVLGALAREQEPSAIDQMFWLFLKSAEDITRSSTPKMLFEVTVARLQSIEAVVPVEKLLAQLEQLQVAQPQAVPARPAVRAEPVEARTKAVVGWADFLQWIKTERPQVASILEHAHKADLQESTVTLSFSESGKVYREMLSEPDRKLQTENLLKAFFKKPLLLMLDESAASAAGHDPLAAKTEKKKQLQQEALQSDIVKEAADILGARIHDVRTLEE